MRQLSAAAIVLLLSREQTDPFIVLLTIEHPELGAPIRVARNTVGEDVVSRGETFTAFPFEVQLATDTEQPPTANIGIMNVDRRIGFAVKRIVTPARCMFECVLASAPDVVEVAYRRFKLRNVRVNALAVTGTLSQFDGSGEPWPYQRVIPSNFSAIFRV